MAAKGKKENLKPFEKGDKRINRRGRPKDLLGLRKLAQSIAHETLPGDKAMTVAEALMRKWAGSHDARLQIKFVEYGFGKVPDAVELTGKDGEAIRIQDADATADLLVSRIDSIEARIGASAATSGDSQE